MRVVLVFFYAPFPKKFCKTGAGLTIIELRHSKYNTKTEFFKDQSFFLPYQNNCKNILKLPGHAGACGKYVNKVNFLKQV